VIAGLSLAFDIAFAHLRRRKRQTTVSVLGVSLGVGFFIAMSALMQGFQTFFVSKIIDVAPHVTVKDEFRSARRQAADIAFPGGAVEVGGVKPVDEIRGIRGAKSMMSDLSGAGGVEAAPTLRGQIILRYGTKDVAAAVLGIEPARERRVTNLETDLISGRLDDLVTTANGIILGSGVAEKLGAKAGDGLIALSPAGVTLRVKVVGIFRTGIVSLDNFETYLLLRRVQALLGRPNVINQLRLKLDDATKAGDVASVIEGRYGYRSEGWEELNRNVLGVFVIQHGIMYATIGAILIVASFGIFNIISTVVHEKARDIAILRAIGFAEADIRAVFLIEGAVIGCIGSVLGWGVGWAICRALAAVRFDIESFVRIQGFVLHETPAQYVVGAALALGAATFAAYLPARKAALARPVEVLRGAA
jgi:lipoprotein-releasing system permease protein